MKNNLENAKKSLLNQMQEDADWRNYWRDIIFYLTHEYGLVDSETADLYYFMMQKINNQ